MKTYFLMSIIYLPIFFFCLGCSKREDFRKINPQVKEIVLVDRSNTKVIKKVFRIDDIVVQTVVFSNGVPNGEIVYYEKFSSESLLLCKGYFVNGKPYSGRFVLNNNAEIVLDGILPFYFVEPPVFVDYKEGKRVKVQ